MSEQNGRNSGWKGGKSVFAVCVAVIVLLLAVIVYLLSSRQGEQPVKRNVVVNEDNVDSVLQHLGEEEIVPPGYYEVTMNSTWNFASGDMPSDNAYVKNAETNKNSVYFDVVRADNEETIYESPILPVGDRKSVV